MGCVASKLEEAQVVVICRERRRQLKLAVEKRFALAEAHCKYCQALYAVSAAIKLFVARHASPASPYLITFPPASGSSSPPSQNDQKVIDNPMFLEQNPLSETNHEDIVCESCGSTTTSDSCDDEEQEGKEEQVLGEEQTCMYYNYMQMPQSMSTEQVVREEVARMYFNYMQMPPPPSAAAMPLPGRDFEWDFFNPFDGIKPEVMSSFKRISDSELRAVREQEGIPELEEEEDREKEERTIVMDGENVQKEAEKSEAGAVNVVDEDNVSQEKPRGLTVLDSPEKGRELLEALKDIEDHFIRAYDSGKEVSRMLEVNKVHLLSNLEGIKENSNKLMQQAITWHRSTSSKPSSCRSLVVSTSKNSLTWNEFNNDHFDDCGVMNAGSHSSTLERLCAWEKKLFDQVKEGDDTRKIYERKCSRLRDQDFRGDDGHFTDKTRASIKDLYARILVAIRSAETISNRIDKIRDKELQPQVVELLKGLTNNWKIMSECHEIQNKIISEVKTLACPTYVKFCNDSLRIATLQLEAELLNWRACFTSYVAAQKAYVESLHGWLTKFLVPEVEFCSKSKRSSAPYHLEGPPLLVICHDWLASMDRLPNKAVSFALKRFSKETRALWLQQGEEQHQKRKVDSLMKELERRSMAFQKMETRFVEAKLTEMRSLEKESDTHSQNEYLTMKRDQLDMFRRKLEAENEKHQNCIQETQRITLNGIQAGFSTVFDSLAEFSKTSLKMYNDLLTYSENGGKDGNQSYIEGSQVEENDSS